MQEPIHKMVGRKLLSIRKTRGLSLDQVAELTGVSKAMLGQIERGDSNPTISVLWKIVSGLQISFTSLIEDDEPKITVVRSEDLSSFDEEDGQYRAYPSSLFIRRKVLKSTPSRWSKAAPMLRSHITRASKSTS